MSQRQQLLAELKSRFMILPYDAKAAAIAAELRSDKDFLASLNQDEIGRTPVHIKSDIVIVATAKAFQKNGVDKLYTHDRNMRTLAARVCLPSADMPHPSDRDAQPIPSGKKDQPPLFDINPSA